MTKKLFLSILLCLVVTVCANAAKSAGTVRMVKQPDGTMLSIQLLGDEHFSWYQTPDGVLLQKDGNAFYVGSVTGTGALESSGVIAHDAGTRSSEERAAVTKQDKEKFFVQAEEEVSKSKMSMSGNTVTAIEGYPSRWYCPHKGVVKVPIILMNYTDTVFRIGKTDAEVKAAFEKYFSDETRTPYSSDTRFDGYSSVKQYFKDASDGNLQFEFVVYGPYTSAYGHDYYGYNTGKSTTLLREAVTKAQAAGVNFDDYVQEGYDYVNMVCVMYAGAGANLSGDNKDFWPACYFNQSIGTKGKYIINTICGFPELAVYPYQFGGEIVRAGIGVTCHEMAHGLGLPDLYNDFGNITNNNNNGPEDWDLMDGGENLYNGMWPCQMTAWEKDIMGWRDAVELTEPTDITLFPANKENGKIYKVINPANKNEWYTIEAYQKDEWNYYVNAAYGSGLMIMHINTYPNSSSTALNMKPNTTAGKPNVTILPADQFILSSYNVGKTFVYQGKSQTITWDMFYNDLRGDPYIGTRAATQVTSLAAYKNYAGDEMVTKYPITDITRNSDGSISFKFMGGTPGDANGDYSINVTDVATIVGYLNGETPEDFHEKAADVNGDGVVDVNDVKALEEKILSGE